MIDLQLVPKLTAHQAETASVARGNCDSRAVEPNTQPSIGTFDSFDSTTVSDGYRVRLKK